jgi:hypothetical protein
MAVRKQTGPDEKKPLSIPVGLEIDAEANARRQQWKRCDFRRRKGSGWTNHFEQRRYSILGVAVNPFPCGLDRCGFIVVRRASHSFRPTDAEFESID